MPKETPVTVGKDPIEILGHQRSVRSSRGEPRLVEMSIVETVVTAQHFYNLGCDQTFGGTIPRIAHSRFGVRHKLTVPPNVVIPQRMDNEVSFEGDASTPLWYTGEDFVPDQTGFWTGYNQVRFRDTTSYASVAINTAHPYADENYSYFTVGFPVSVWPMVCRTNFNGNVDLELPEYCGNVIAATAQGLWGNTLTLTGQPFLNFGATIGSVGVTMTTCPVTSGASGEKQEGHPGLSNRMVRVTTGNAADDDKEVLINVFCAPRGGSRVRVRVISQVWENVPAPRVYVYPSSDAIAAG